VLPEKPRTRLRAADLAGPNRHAQASNRGFQVAHPLSDPHPLAAKIFAAGHELLRREANAIKFRRIGSTVLQFSTRLAAILTIFSTRGDLRAAAAKYALDQVRAKFGRSTSEKQRHGLNGKAWCS
jgi:DNA polymerase-4